jgi:hypothetical protein
VSVETACVLGAGGLLFVGFLYVEKSRDEAAMMPLSLFGSANFIGLTLLTLLLYGALGGLLLLVPYVLIGARGYSAAMAGAALLPLPLVIALTSSQMGKLAVRTGASAPLSIGAIIVAVGCVLATRIGIERSYWATTFPAVLTISLGMGAAVAPLTTAVLASVETKRSGVASGLNSAVARTGGLIATAVASVVLGAHGTMLVSAYQIACLVGSGDAHFCGCVLPARGAREMRILPVAPAAAFWRQRVRRGIQSACRAAAAWRRRHGIRLAGPSHPVLPRCKRRHAGSRTAWSRRTSPASAAKPELT